MHTYIHTCYGYVTVTLLHYKNVITLHYNNITVITLHCIMLPCYVTVT